MKGTAPGALLWPSPPPKIHLHDGRTDEATAQGLIYTTSQTESGEEGLRAHDAILPSRLRNGQVTEHPSFVPALQVIAFGSADKERSSAVVQAGTPAAETRPRTSKFTVGF